MPNCEKSNWVPTPVLHRLGFTTDLFQGLHFVPGKKIKCLLSDINSLLEDNYCTARELSPLAGQI